MQNQYHDRINNNHTMNTEGTSSVEPKQDGNNGGFPTTGNTVGNNNRDKGKNLPGPSSENGQIPITTSPIIVGATGNHTWRRIDSEAHRYRDSNRTATQERRNTNLPTQDLDKEELQKEIEKSQSQRVVVSNTEEEMTVSDASEPTRRAETNVSNGKGDRAEGRLTVTWKRKWFLAEIGVSKGEGERTWGSARESQKGRLSWKRKGRGRKRATEKRVSPWGQQLGGRGKYVSIGKRPSLEKRKALVPSDAVASEKKQTDLTAEKMGQMCQTESRAGENIYGENGPNGLSEWGSNLEIIKLGPQGNLVLNQSGFPKELETNEYTEHGSNKGQQDETTKHLSFLAAMQGFDKEIVTNAMAKMENLVQSDTSRGRAKHRQPSRFPKKTRLKLRKTVESMRAPEANSTSEMAGLINQEGIGHPETSMDKEVATKETNNTDGNAKVEVSDANSEDHHTGNETKYSPLITPNRRSRRL